MKCPACSKELNELRVDDLMVDICDRGCGGIWFDAFELQRVDEPHETTGARLARVVPGGDLLPPDKDAKRECPRCPNIKLRKHFFSAKRRVRVDQCPSCGGYWLDHRELDLIRAETQEAKQEEKKKQGLSMETIRQLYRLRLEAREQGRTNPPA